MRKSISDETNIERIEHKSKKNIALGTIFGYLAILISVAYGIFMTPEIIRTVGDSEYGLYGLSSSIVNIFLLDFGLSVAINTYLAKLRANNDKAGVEKFLASIFKIYLWLDIFFILVIGVLVFSAPYVFSQTYGNPATFEVTPQIRTLQYLFIIVGGYTIISLPSSCFNGVIQTYEKFSYVKLMDMLHKTLYLVFSILSIQLRWEINGSGIIPIVLINVSAALFAILLRFVYMRTYLNIRLDLRLSITKEEKKQVFKFSAWGFVAAICNRLAFNITPFILSIVSNDHAVAVFSLVTTLELYIFTFGEIITQFFVAKVARTEANVSEEEQRKRIQALGEKFGKLQLVIIGLIYLGFLSVGQEFIMFWLKDEKYMIIYWCIMAICSYEIFHMPSIIFENSMLIHGYIKPLGIIAVVKAAVNLSLSFLLSYLFTRWYANMYFGAGALGAAIAVLCGRVTYMILDFVCFKKYLKISISHFFKSVYGRAIFTMVISLAIGLGLHFLNVIPYNWLKFLVNGFVFVGVYFLCTIFITFNKEERGYYVGVLMELLHIKKKNKAVTPEGEAIEIEENKEVENKEEEE